MKSLSTIALCLALILVPSLVFAGLTFIPNTYGLSPRSVGLGNAMTAVGNDYSMTYFNPGALGDLETSQIDLGYLYADPRLEGGVKGGDKKKFNTDNEVVLVGITADLSGLFKNEHGLGLGFDIAIDNNLKSFLNFEETRSDSGQFARYGLSSVTMVTALGVEIIPQIHLGLGGYIMVKGENTLVAETDLAGNTQKEEIQVSAEPVFAPIAGLYLPVHEMVTLGLVYRGAGLAQFSAIDASTDALVSQSSLTTLNLLLAFKDTYVPQQAALGIAIRPVPSLLLALDGTWFNWGEYDDEIKSGDDVWGDANLTTHDVWVPRLGIEYSPIEELYLRCGYYYEDTPFADPGMNDTVVLDNAKHVASLGVGWDVSYIPFLQHPLTVGASYFGQFMVPRTVENDFGVEYESSGVVHGVVGSLTLRF